MEPPKAVLEARKIVDGYETGEYTIGEATVLLLGNIAESLAVLSIAEQIRQEKTAADGRPPAETF